MEPHLRGVILSPSHSIAQIVNNRLGAKLDAIMVPFKQKHSDVSATTLKKDRYAVLSAEPAVKRQLSDSGFSDAQMDDALIASWRALRSRRKAAQAIEAIDIVKESAKQGLLVVDSVPEGAAVIINGEQYESTKTSRWLVAGVYHIILRKDGYPPVKDNQEVPAGKTVTFSRNLLPVGRQR
jgi:PEGA domain